MSITKELREWTDCDASLVGFQRADLYAIADRIDAAHEEGMRKAYVIGSAIADDWYADKTDDDLVEHGLVRLPVDADGKVIRPDDDVIIMPSRTKAKVAWLSLNGRGWSVTTDFIGGEHSCGPSELRHRKPTPAERIRRWVDRARDDRADLGDLLAIAGELEADHE